MEISPKVEVTKQEHTCVISKEEIDYCYELEGECKINELISLFKNDKETLIKLKNNDPVLIYLHRTGEIVDGLVSCIVVNEEEASAVFLVRYEGIVYENATWGALNKKIKYFDDIINVDPINNFGILFLSDKNKEFSVIAL